MSGPTTPETLAILDAVGLDGRVFVAIFEQMEWAEEEIKAAQERHPEQADAIHGSFLLLRATDDLMRTERVYRAHCRELLDRVAAGADTRAATNVEVACGLSEASLRAPLGTAGTAVYMRVFASAFPDEWEGIGGDDGLDEAHRAVAGPLADDLERQLRDAAVQDWRTPEGAAT